MRQIGFPRMGLLLLGIVGGLLLRTQAAGIDELVEADSLERIATGFRFTEGPVWHPDGYLLFSDIPANTIYKWLPDGRVETFRSPSGHANGLTFDRRGRLIACEHSNRQVSRTEPNGTIVTLANEYDGKVNFVKLNVDDNPQIASQYGVMSIPTLIIFKDGKPASTVVGFRPKAELKKSLDAAL